MSTTDPSTYLHEFGHHIESVRPEVARALWAFYVRRTGGADTSTEPMGHGFEPHEFTRPDEFFNRYAGKDYGRTSRRPGPRSRVLLHQSRQPVTVTGWSSELFTMGLEGTFYRKRGRGPDRGDPGNSRAPRGIDDDYASFILGVLLHQSRQPVTVDREDVDPSDAEGGGGVDAGAPAAV